METEIYVKDLVMGFLGKTEDAVSRAQLAPGWVMYKAGRKILDAEQTGVTFYVSETQAFFTIFDSDFGNRCTVQKTYWNDSTDDLYNMLKKHAVPNKKFPGGEGFFIEDSNLGFVFIEKQILEGSECITASLETVLYC